MRFKVFGLVMIIVLIFSISAFAGWDEKPEFRLSETYRYDLRHSEERHLNINRISAILEYLDEAEKSLVKVTPFFEARRNLDRDLWERLEVGVEVGKDIFPWMYLGTGIQGVWLKEKYKDIRNYTKRDSSVESEARLLFSTQLFSIKDIPVTGFVLEEYTIDFEERKGVRNEVAIGLTAPLNQYLQTGINWRHIDRVGDYDCDTVEASVNLVF